VVSMTPDQRAACWFVKTQAEAIDGGTRETTRDVAAIVRERFYGGGSVMSEIDEKWIAAAYHAVERRVALSNQHEDERLIARTAITAYLSARSPAPEGWQDISTAPRDGTVIYLAKGNAVAPGYWATCPQVVSVMADKKYPWEILDPANGTNAWPDDAHGPTHWMPLPTAPKGAPHD